MARKCTLAVRRDICWAPCNIINNGNQVEMEDGRSPWENACVCQDDLMRPWKTFTRPPETIRGENTRTAGGEVQCSKNAYLWQRNEEGVGLGSRSE
jgi:hypothetical protein